MKITVLGSGTSNGIPMIGCQCGVCKSQNPKDKRLRSSVYIEIQGKKIVIDTTPDFRQQFLTNELSDLDYILLTHSHYDHIAGLDEVRPINLFSKKDITLFADKESLKNLKSTFSYIFTPQVQIGGGLPKINSTEIDKEVFFIDDILITPLPIKHGILDIFGYRIGNFAYITDASYIPKSTIKLLQNVDVLFLNALRINPHSTHLNLDSAVNYAGMIKARATYLTHISHGLSHDDTQNILPDNIYLAYDGIIIEC